VARKADERDLFQFFSEVGKVVDVRIIKDTHTKRSKGIAYVEFETQDACLAAVAKSGEKVCGFPIVIQASQAEKNQAARLAAQAQAEANQPTSVEVKNLHVDIGDEDLNALFTPFGSVITAKIERAAGVSTGKGKVEFKTVTDAHKAVTHLNGFDLAGQQLQVTLIQAAMPPPPGVAPQGIAVEVLDDNDQGGVHVTAQSRQALMQKLARGTAVIPGVPGMPPPGMPPPGMPPPGMPPPGMPGMPGMPPPGMPPPGTGPVGVPGAPMPQGQPHPTTFLLLNNMFDPATETETDFHVDIQEDVKEECNSKFGRVLSVNADRENPNGLVYVQFEDVESAVSAQRGLQGRYFAGKMISATFLSPTTFSQCLTQLPRQ
jgi:RNA-binding protein 39